MKLPIPKGGGVLKCNRFVLFDESMSHVPSKIVNLVKLQEVGRILQVSQFIWPTMTPLGQKK